MLSRMPQKLRVHVSKKVALQALTSLCLHKVCVFRVKSATSAQEMKCHTLIRALKDSTVKTRVCKQVLFALSALTIT